MRKFTSSSEAFCGVYMEGNMLTFIFSSCVVMLVSVNRNPLPPQHSEMLLMPAAEWSRSARI